MSDLESQKVRIALRSSSDDIWEEVDGFIVPSKDGLAITPAFGYGNTPLARYSDGPLYIVTQITTGGTIGKARPLDAARTFIKFLFGLDVDWTNIDDIEDKRATIKLAIENFYRNEKRKVKQS